MKHWAIAVSYTHLWGRYAWNCRGDVAAEGNYWDKVLADYYATDAAVALGNTETAEELRRNLTALIVCLANAVGTSGISSIVIGKDVYKRQASG